MSIAQIGCSMFIVMSYGILNVAKQTCFQLKILRVFKMLRFGRLHNIVFR